MNARWIGGLAAVALFAGAIGYQSYRHRSSDGAPQSPPATPAAAENVTPEAGGALTLVERLPEVVLADREGELRSLSDWSGKSLIVNFWATWCAPCRREIPLLQQIQREHGDAGFQVIGIAVDFRDKVLAYAAEMDIEYPLLIGEQEALDAATAFGVEAVGFPFTVFADRRGRVVAAHLGELKQSEADVIIAALAEVNADRLTPQEARANIETRLAALPSHEAGTDRARLD